CVRVTQPLSGRKSIVYNSLIKTVILTTPVRNDGQWRAEYLGSHRPFPCLCPCCRMFELYPRCRYAGRTALLGFGGGSRTGGASRRAAPSPHHQKRVADAGRC